MGGGVGQVTDEGLMIRARRGDGEAFALLVRRHQDRVYTVALRSLGDRAAAEDVAQQAFLRAFERCGAYDRRWRFTTWLYRIVANLCIDEHRRRARWRYVPMDAAIQWGASRDDALEAREAADRLRRGLDGLSPDVRIVLALRYVSEMSYADIAAIRGISIETVKSHLRRGKARLRALLADAGMEGGR